MHANCIARIRLLIALALSAVACQGVWGDEKLESLQGTMIRIVSDEEGLATQLWAKGNNTRVDVTRGERKAITVQLDDTLYTWTEGLNKPGRKQRIGRGLASMGLIKQIEEVKARGKKVSTRETENVRYVEYEYDVNFPEEVAVVFLEEKTSLPRQWLSIVRTSETEAAGLRMLYRDLKANVEIPDRMFELPPDVKFLDVTTASPGAPQAAQVDQRHPSAEAKGRER